MARGDPPQAVSFVRLVDSAQSRGLSMTSDATTVSEYLSRLTEDRRNAIEAVRRVILENLDMDFEEGIQYGMIGYYVPHRVYPAGYHCDPKQPLPFAALGSQKNYMSLYLMCVYGDSDRLDRFRAAWAKTGKKLDMGKACVRFRKVEDLALDVIAETIKGVQAKKYAERCEAALAASKKLAKTSAGKSRAKTTRPKSAKSRASAPKRPRDKSS
jgi:Domain of unknown function (DU1801)